jgi:hypothetical protein
MLQNRVKNMEYELEREKHNTEREARDSKNYRESATRLADELKKVNDRMKATEQRFKKKKKNVYLYLCIFVHCCPHTNIALIHFFFENVFIYIRNK